MIGFSPKSSFLFRVALFGGAARTHFDFERTLGLGLPAAKGHTVKGHLFFLLADSVTPAKRIYRRTIRRN